MLGYTPEEWMAGRLWRELLHPEDRDRIFASDERFETDGAPVDEEYRMLAKDGSAVWVREETVLVRGEGREPLFVQGILTDITARKRAEEALRQSEASLAEAQRIAHVGSWEWNVGSNAITWSEELHRIFGRTPQQFDGTYESFLGYVHPEDRGIVETSIREAFKTGESFAFEHRLLRPDGEVRVLQARGEVFSDANGNLAKMAGITQDVTERKRMEWQLQRQAFRDSLTGLPNRQLFVDRLEQALRRTERGGTSRASTLFLDLDNFKSVNDSLGHETGDLLLVAVAERLEGCVRPEDTLARFGGDEFVVLIEDAEDPSLPIRVAQRITDELRRPFSIAGRELFVGASIGIALGGGRTKSSEDLLRDADTAMYRAKEEAADYRVFDTEMYLRAVGRLELENDLRRAVERGEFFLHYQPIVHLEDAELRGVEALVR